MKAARSAWWSALGACMVLGACAYGSGDVFDDDDGAAGTGQTGSPTGASSGTGTADTTSSGTTSTGLGGAGGSGGTGLGGTGLGGSGGSGGTSCAHDKCVEGIALSPSCDGCVGQVCAADDYCCSSDWDTTCIEEVWDYCGIDCGGGGSGGVGPGDLVINEIMNNPAVVTDANGEWFEIYNDSSASIDLQGLRIRHQAVAVDPNAVHVISASVMIAAGGYAVLGRNGNSATNGQVTVDYAYGSSVSLNNDDDYLAIETSGAVLIDETSWSEGSGLDPSGASRNLDPSFRSAASNDDDAHFCEATSFVTGSSGDRGSPGAANDACP